MARLVILGILLASPGLVAGQEAAARNPLAQYIRVDTPVVALRGVRLIDGTGAPVRLNQTLVIRDGRIAAVGDVAAVRVPEDAQVIDGAGRTVMPGLVMLHEHLVYPTPGGWANLAESFTRLYLAGGVTTMRTAGGPGNYGEFGIKRAIEAARKPGPWIDVTAPFLEGAGGLSQQVHVLKDSADARRMVAFWADAGATSFKAYMNITRQQLAAAIDEAHARGLKITGHLCSITFREAAEMGIDNLEHGFFVATDFLPDKRPDVCPNQFQTSSMQAVAALELDDVRLTSLIALLVDKGVALTSTLPVFETAVAGRPAPPGLDVLVPSIREQVEQVRALREAHPNALLARLYPKAAAMEVAFFRAGGLLVAGTDPAGQGAVIPGFANQRAVELLVEAGLTPLEAIRVCTLNGATYLGIADRTGSLAVGKDADIILIQGDPSERIADIRKVELVFRHGVGLDPERLVNSVRGRVGLY